MAAFRCLFSGICRVQIDEYVENEPFLRVRVTEPEETQPTGPQAEALVAMPPVYSSAMHNSIAVSRLKILILLSHSKHSARLSDTLAAHVVTDMGQQQDLLETSRFPGTPGEDLRDHGQ